MAKTMMPSQDEIQIACSHIVPKYLGKATSLNNEAYVHVMEISIRVS